MGTGASIPDEGIDELTAKSLAGDNFDPDAFATAAVNGKVSKHDANMWAAQNLQTQQAMEDGKKKEDNNNNNNNNNTASVIQIKEAHAHFHAPFQVSGEPKPESLNLCDQLALKFAAAMASHGKNNDLINLFAEGATWVDPAGSSPYVGTEALTARIAKLPPIQNVEVKEVFYSMSPKIFLAKTEVTFVGKPPFIVLDSFQVNDAQTKILNLESHFHGPYQVGGAPKPEALVVCDRVAERFAQALFSHGKNDDLINMFGQGGTWSDPVPLPPYDTKEKILARIAKLPPMDKVEVQEVFYCMNPKIFHAKTEVTFTGKSPVIILDKFVLE